MALLSVCGEQHIVLKTASIELPMGLLWTITQLDVAHWYWKLRLVTTDAQLGLCLPHYLAISLRFSSYMHVF